MAARKKQTSKTATKKSAKTTPRVAKKTDAVKESTTSAKNLKLTNKKKRRFFAKPKGIIVGAIVVIILAALLYKFKGLFVVAMVNGQPITQYELISSLEKTYGTQEVDNLVTKRLIMQTAAKQNITVSDKEVQDQIDQLDNQLKAQNTTIQQYLTYQGMTMDQLKENVRLRKIVEGILNDKLAVTDAEIEKYYNDNKDSFADKKLADVHDQIKSQLESNKLSAEFQTWLTNQRSQSKIYYLTTF